MGAWEKAQAPSAAHEKEVADRAAYTASHAMSREDFIKKYGTTFVADDKGGNAASEVAGMDVGAYYDRYLDPNAPKTEVIHTLRDGDRTQAIGFGGGSQYSNSKPFFDAYDNVDPHPASNRLSGLDQLWTDMIRPIGTIAAVAYGANLVGGALGAGTSGTTAAGAASTQAGLVPLTASTVPSSAVASVTASSTLPAASAWSSWVPSAISGGTTLARGGSIGDAVKNAGMTYLAGGLGGEVSSAVGGGAAGKLAGSAARAAVTGGNPLLAMLNTGANQLIGDAGDNPFLATAKQMGAGAMVSSMFGQNGGTQAAPKGSNAERLATQYAASQGSGGQATSWPTSFAQMSTPGQQQVQSSLAALMNASPTYKESAVAVDHDFKPIAFQTQGAAPQGPASAGISSQYDNDAIAALIESSKRGNSWSEDLVAATVGQKTLFRR